MPSGPSWVPRNLSQADAEIVLFEGARSGERKVSSPSCITTVSILPPRSARAVATMSRAPLTALRSLPVTSMKRSCLPTVTVVRTPLIMGGKERTEPFLSRMIGYWSKPSRRWAYALPFSFLSRISDRSISSSMARGTNLTEWGSTSLYTNGGSTLFRSWMPMASLLLFLPMVMCSFSCSSIMDLRNSSSMSTPLTTPQRNQGLMALTLGSTVTSMSPSVTSYFFIPGSMSRNARSALARPSTL